MMARLSGQLVEALEDSQLNRKVSLFFGRNNFVQRQEVKIGKSSYSLGGPSHSPGVNQTAAIAI